MPPVLAFFSFDLSFTVEKEESSASVGAVLEQRKEDGHEHPIEFSSRTMNNKSKKKRSLSSLL